MRAYGLATLGRDAEARFLPDGTAVANLSLAFTWGKKGTDGKRPTQWVDAALWRPHEALLPYLVKGGKVVASLSDVRIETFTKSDGSTGTKLAARVDGIELAGSPQHQASAPPPPAPAPAPKPAPASSAGYDADLDDVPFQNPYRGRISLAV